LTPRFARYRTPMSLHGPAPFALLRTPSSASVLFSELLPFTLPRDGLFFVYPAVFLITCDRHRLAAPVASLFSKKDPSPPSSFPFIVASSVIGGSCLVSPLSKGLPSHLFRLSYHRSSFFSVVAQYNVSCVPLSPLRSVVTSHIAVMIGLSGFWDLSTVMLYNWLPSLL